MGQHLLLRLGQLIPVLILASIAIWALIYFLPGDPAVAVLGPNATPAEVAAERHALGLDQPVPVQYLLWVGRVVHGDFGVSYISGLPVLSLIAPRAQASLQLGVLAFLFSLLVGVPLGVRAAARPQGPVNALISSYNSLTLAIPTFWLGILLILVFGVWLHLLPTTSDFVPIWEDPPGALQISVMPILTLGLYVSGIIARFVRSAMQDVLTSDFIRLARAKGVREGRVIWRHALRNAMLPTVTVVGLQFGAFIGGAVVTESVFGYPGLGTLLLRSVLQRDYTTLQATMLLIVVAFTLVNLAVDLVYAFLDPRIHYR